MVQQETSSKLPLHARNAGARNERQRRLQFERPSPRETWKSWVGRIMRKWVQASTGSPSDGLGRDASDSGASFNTFLASQAQLDREKEDCDWVLDEVVVTGDEADGHRQGSEKGTTTRQSESEVAGSLHRVQGSQWEGETHRDTSGLRGFVRYVLWPNLVDFFDPRFEDEAKEQEYQKQVWYSNKKLAFAASLYLYINWILYLIFNHSVSLYEKIAYYGGLTFVTLPLPFMIVCNMPRRHPKAFQIWLCLATWYCGLTEVIQMRQCRFFRTPQRHCNRKDFLAMMYYNTAVPTLMMFVISHRLYNVIMSIVIVGLWAGLVLPVQTVFVRNVVGFVSALLIRMIAADRRMFMLNSQLKVAYRAQQKAQMAESKASLAKRRFASYIFHEVRVPLNTALLAFQNLQENNAFADYEESQNVEIHALEASLYMMQQVLNDVLDLERMDSGRFDSNPRPFPLHRAINSIMGPVGLASHAKRLTLRLELDKKIDELADPNLPEGLWVVGDEIRLRQVLTNLASNAVKFTPEGGGEVALTTRLLEYQEPPLRPPVIERASKSSQDAATKDELAVIRSDSGQRSHHGRDVHVPTVRFRIEVSDSGPGIRPSDLVENRLFQPFVQTAVGRTNGKGTGLGLAIIRQIVTLTGGRLGVQSRRGQGATFWVELAFPVAGMQEIQLARNSSPPTPPLSKPAPAKPMKPEKDTLGIAPYTDPANNPLATAQRPAPPDPSSSGSVSGSGTGSSSYDVRPLPAPILTSSLQPRSRRQEGSGGAVCPPDNPLKVLVVDDDELTRSLMSRMLGKQGCAVETAVDGQECLDILIEQDRRFDLITLDNFMPHMSGEEAVRRLREAGRDDLVIGCTGNALMEDQTSYLDAGADRILTKPIMLRDLKDALGWALQRRAEAASQRIVAPGQSEGVDSASKGG
ncbi:hypothetical protein AURDEDRAFT_105975 [Auricularia subglabra TFB-10046 SS5]|nr:hypothetical protein AURDEDRAFT_105975 [Auricularia subglabra TFB-10046 SS5]